jgi:cytochrome c
MRKEHFFRNDWKVSMIKSGRSSFTVICSVVALSACGSPGETADQQLGNEPATIAPATAQAAVSPGKLQFLQCAACHAVEAGAPPKVGPNLHCVIGRKAGSLAEFDYSGAFETPAAQGLTWDRDTLLSFMEKPMEVIPGNAMAFGGVAKVEDREAIADYLQQMCQTDAS